MFTRNLIVLVLCTIGILISSCREDFESIPSTGNLEFSTKTLLLDTVFTNISSSTYKFKVYNRSNEDIHIPKIILERGESSNYRLNIDGFDGKSFEDILIRAKDSVFVFVETTTDILDQTNELEFLYEDRILFDPDKNQQVVELITLVKDAVFIVPNRNCVIMDDKEVCRIEGILFEGDDESIPAHVLGANELNFTNEKPYVIYGYAFVPDNMTLTIDAGARIHFHSNGGIIVGSNATLLVNGEPSTDPVKMEGEVIFEGDRLEPGFSEIPGQWLTIFLSPGSVGNRINHATIKNATSGIFLNSINESNGPALTLTNTQIYNSSTTGLFSLNGSVTGENVVINNAGLYSLYAPLGGKYNFNHCTFTNYVNNIGSSRTTPAVLFGNFIKIKNEDGTEVPFESDLIEATINNTIIYGDIKTELELKKGSNRAFNYNFKNCLLKFDEDDININNPELYDFSNTVLFENMILNEKPYFKRSLPKFIDNNEEIDDLLKDRSNNFMNIGEESAANGKATSPGMGTDILGTPRDANAPDIGAYESIKFDKDVN